MVDQSKFIMLKKKFEQYDQNNTPYGFTMFGCFDDPSVEPFNIITNAKGADVLDKNMENALNALKPDYIKVTVFRGTKMGAVDDDVEIRVKKIAKPEKRNSAEEITQPATKPKENTIIDKLNEVITRLDSAQQEKIALLGSISDSRINEVNNQHKTELIEFKHELEMKEKDRQIKKLEEDIDELEDELKEAMQLVDKFQGQIEKEGKLESSARDATAVVKGVLSMAPGLMKVADKFGLGGIAKALIDDSPSNELSETAESNNISEFNDQKLEKVQRVLQYCQTLSDEQMDMLLVIINGFEKNPSTLKDLTDLIKQS